MRIFLIPLMVWFLFSNQTAQGTFFGQHQRGWHWYEPQALPQEKKPKEDGPQKESKTPPKKKTKTPAEVLAAYRKELENRLAQAWITPTLQNLKAYQTMQKDMVDRSKAFSDVWMKSVFTHPDLDHTLVTPVNQKARHVALDLEKDRIHQTIKDLSKTYGLFFFFSGGCKFCHAFAPIVKQFSETYGWEVLAITLDGEKVEPFERPLPDNGLFKKWGSDVLPALYAVNPETGHVIPVALGMVSLDQMETRIMKLVEESQ